MKTLFEIKNEYLHTIQQLEDYCEENGTDELPEELTEKLQINQQELDSKLENYWYIIKQLKGDEKTLSDHIAQMNKKKKAVQNSIKRLTRYIGEAVEAYGEENKSGNMFYEHTLFKTTASRSSRITITDDSKIPERFKKEVTTVKVNGAQVKKAIQEGETFEGAFIDDSDILVKFT